MTGMIKAYPRVSPLQDRCLDRCMPTRRKVDIVQVGGKLSRDRRPQGGPPRHHQHLQRQRDIPAENDTLVAEGAAARMASNVCRALPP